MATFTKLRSGDWGITGSASEVRLGATVTVKKVVWSGNGKAIAAIEDGGSRNGGRSSGKRCHCGKAISGKYDECWECVQCELCGKNKYTCGHCIGW